MIRRATFREFDRWLVQNATRDPAQLSWTASRSPGVGVVRIKRREGARMGTCAAHGYQDGPGVDAVYVYRADDGRLVWWDIDTQAICEVDPTDRRLELYATGNSCDQRAVA